MPMTGAVDGAVSPLPATINLRGLKCGISSGPIHKVSTAARGNPSVICARDHPDAR
jgi:hypothetical protein